RARTAPPLARTRPAPPPPADPARAGAPPRCGRSARAPRPPRCAAAPSTGPPRPEPPAAAPDRLRRPPTARRPAHTAPPPPRPAPRPGRAARPDGPEPPTGPPPPRPTATAPPTPRGTAADARRPHRAPRPRSAGTRRLPRTAGTASRNGGAPREPDAAQITGSGPGLFPGAGRTADAGEPTGHRKAGPPAAAAGPAPAARDSGRRTGDPHRSERCERALRPDSSMPAPSPRTERPGFGVPRSKRSGRPEYVQAVAVPTRWRGGVLPVLTRGRRVCSPRPRRLPALLDDLI